MSRFRIHACPCGHARDRGAVVTPLQCPRCGLEATARAEPVTRPPALRALEAGPLHVAQGRGLARQAPRHAWGLAR